MKSLDSTQSRSDARRFGAASPRFSFLNGSSLGFSFLNGSSLEGSSLEGSSLERAHPESSDSSVPRSWAPLVPIIVRGVMVAAGGLLLACTSGIELDGAEEDGAEEDGDDDDSSESGSFVPDAGDAGEVTDILIGSGNDVDGGESACGNGRLDDGEACDDGNLTDGDGCSEDCSEVEDGFECDEDGDCTVALVCGNGLVQSGEACDDGNDEPDDGCSAACQVESGSACPVPGEACVSIVDCGDGIILGDEQCDDGNTEAGDGCSDACTVELGATCAAPGRPCLPICGDGLVVLSEQCDDGNTDSDDGCSDTCSAEVGWVCEEPGEACRESVCGDGVVEGGEACDDGGNNDLGDGCSPGCVLEPDCSAGACTSACGDGLLLAGDDEECDDGNTDSGDGCDENCELEAGFECTLVSDSDDGRLQLPVIYRDFKGFVGVDWEVPLTGGHPDFENPAFSEGGKNLVTGIARVTLGQPATPGEVAYKPVYDAATEVHTTGAANYHQWYVDTPGVNVTVADTLTLTEIAGGTGTFEYDDTRFFPLDNRGFTEPNAAGEREEPMRPNTWFGSDCQTGSPFELHNFAFTSEVRYWFEYAGGEQLSFRGDDDVWVFIAGRLVVDLGGVHEVAPNEVTGDVGTITLSEDAVDVTGTPLNLEVGKVYESVVFQAERHTCESNYRLTLSGFSRSRTQCQSVCGDGIVTAGEICDNGEDNGDGYGQCTDECVPGPTCGDGIENGPEDCDNGLNIDVYQTSDEACAPGCVEPGFCGDGVIDSGFSEECDDGEDNDGSYDGCNEDCSLGPRCGDGEVNGDEACDDGNRANGDGCNVSCERELVGGAR